MITVPKSNVVQLRGKAPAERPDPVYLAMAAADMHANNRLIEPEVPPDGAKPK